VKEEPTQRLRDALEQERMRIQAEIRSYPMPIPACDVCFNDLLEQRARVGAELARVDELLKARQD
jgi:hypothetical protein